VWGEMIQYKNQNGWMLAISCIDGLLHRCSIRASPRRRIILPYRPVIQSELPLAGLPGPEGAYFRSRRRALTTFLFVDHGHRDYESFLGSPLVVGRLCNRRNLLSAKVRCCSLSLFLPVAARRSPRLV
jgi:hypothetical protein